MFYLEKSDQKIILAIRHHILNVSEITKKVNITFAQVAKRIIILEEEGIIVTEKKGRIRSVWLTDAGTRLFICFRYVLE